MRFILSMFCLMLAAGLAQAQGCAEKEAEVRRKLQQAQEQGHDGRIRGLETALKSLQASCTEAGLQAERQDAIDEARREVVEREADLREAQADGSPEKIEKRQRKLSEAQEQLQDAQAR